MLDRHEARLWADHHHDFAAAVADLLHQVRDAFAALTRIQYDRPWAVRDRTR